MYLPSLGTRSNPISCGRLPFEEGQQKAREVGLGDYPISTLLTMFRCYDKHGLWGSSHVLDCLLGWEATTFGSLVMRVIGDDG